MSSICQVFPAQWPFRSQAQSLPRCQALTNCSVCLLRWFVVMSLSTLGLSGCGGPLVIFAGGALHGESLPFTEQHTPAEGGIFALEVRPSDPYSVNVNMFVIDGGLYIDPAKDRQWFAFLKQDANVRVRFERNGAVYEARVSPVESPAILKQFDPDRVVLRIAPRLREGGG